MTTSTDSQQTAEAGMTLDQAQGALIAIAPIVGSARIASSAGKVLRAYGLGDALSDRS